MPFIQSERAFERYLRDGRNSSHFVWHLAGLTFFESSNGWVFGFKQQGNVTLLALEPLIPGAPVQYGAEHSVAFRLAWGEFTDSVKPDVCAFVSVYKAFALLLEAEGFQTLKVGQEPWVELSDCIPKGNAGKGVRSARNQALHAGLRVEEWKASEIASDPGKRDILEKIYQEWKSTRVVDLGGFLNATDPFQHMDTRRYFVLRSPERIEAYLVATPVPGIGSWFLEDLIIRHHAPRGTGELVTLEAMVALNESHGKAASLGVISITSIDASMAHGLPAAMKFLLLTLPKYLMRVYNFNGIEIYRKRFKPHHWDEIHLAVKNCRPAHRSDTSAWLGTLCALGLAFRPRFQPSFGLIWSQLTRPLRKFPIASFIALLSTALFLTFNVFLHQPGTPPGELPDWALSIFGFSGSAPLREWLMRSVVSDFLYFDPLHFLLWGSMLVYMARWAEKTHKRAFLVPTVIAISVFDDFINYICIVKPFGYFQPGLFQHLVQHKDVGGSLVLATLAGLQLCQYQRVREPLFALIGMALVFGFAFTSASNQHLVMNLNHFLFFCIGYLVGKFRFEYLRAQSRKTARKKPPQGKCVLMPSPTSNQKKAEAA